MHPRILSATLEPVVIHIPGDMVLLGPNETSGSPDFTPGNAHVAPCGARDQTPDLHILGL